MNTATGSKVATGDATVATSDVTAAASEDEKIFEDVLIKEGLGMGIDATHPDTLLRTQVEPKKEIVKRLRLGAGWSAFNSSVWSYKDLKRELNISLSANVKPVCVSFGVDIKVQRSESVQKMAQGYQIFCRTIKFDEEKLGKMTCHLEEWLVEEEKKAKPPLTEHDRKMIARYVVMEMNKGVTHYISAIDMGAKVYELREETTEEKGKDVKVEVGGEVDKTVTAGVYLKSQFDKLVRSHTQSIQVVVDPHVLDDLKAGSKIDIKPKYQKTISYEVSPVWELIHDCHWQEAVREVCQEYVEGKGPFCIKCNDSYLKLDTDAKRFTQEKDIKLASQFYIEVSQESQESPNHNCTCDMSASKDSHCKCRCQDETLNPALPNHNVRYTCAISASKDPHCGFRFRDEEGRYITFNTSKSAAFPTYSPKFDAQGKFYLAHPGTRDLVTLSEWKDDAFLLKRETWLLHRDEFLVMKPDVDDKFVLAEKRKSCLKGTEFCQFSLEVPKFVVGNVTTARDLGCGKHAC